MARVKGAMMTRKRRNKVLKLAKGYWGSKSKHFKMAKAFKSHILTKKPTKRTRHLRAGGYADATVAGTIRKMIPYK